MKKVVIVVLLLFAIGCVTKEVTPVVVEAKQPYDPNALQYRYLEVAEPNWVATFGDTLETRMLYNISKNRVKIAMIDKRLSAVDPNGVKE